MSSSKTLVLLCGLTVATSSCASLSRRHPLSDVLSVRLRWAGPADLDLHVVDPAGQEIWFNERLAPSGGRLDVDCNATPDTACPHPLEHVAWPPGEAPEGRYQFWVHVMNLHDAILPVEFRVHVIHGATVLAARRGRLGRIGDRSQTWTVDYRVR